MTGREDPKENDLFFTCSLIEYIARKTKNKRNDVAAARYAVPSHWDIGKIYKRLILGIAREKGLPIIDALFEAYHSFVTDKISITTAAFITTPRRTF